jgi:hypothetical protein
MRACVFRNFPCLHAISAPKLPRLLLTTAKPRRPIIAHIRNRVALLQCRRAEHLSYLPRLRLALSRSASNRLLPLQAPGHLHPLEALCRKSRPQRKMDKPKKDRMTTMMPTRVSRYIFTACVFHTIYAPDPFFLGTSLPMHRTFRPHLVHSANVPSQTRAELRHETNNSPAMTGRHQALASPAQRFQVDGVTF